MIVVEEGRVRGRFLATQCAKGRTIHQIDIQPAIAVIIEERHAGARCFQDELLIRVAAHMLKTL